MLNLVPRPSLRRRDFLHPRHVASAAGVVAGALDEVSALANEPVTEEIALVRLGWRAMATRFEIACPFETPSAMEAAQDAFELLDALEDQLTVYRDHSEVCQLNRQAPGRPVRVERRLFALLELANRLYQDTGGAFDVTAGALIKAWGFFRGPRRVPGDAERQEALAKVGMQHVALDGARKTVHFRRPGIEINLGAIGKGYALDRMAERLARRWHLPAFLIHGGGSSVLGHGSPEGGRGWQVRIRHPWRADRCVAKVWLRGRALGTSAATFQYLEHEGKKLGHILDPRTGWPAGGLASVSVVAPTAALADALSTAFYVGGVDIARQYCETNPSVGAILLLERSPRPVAIGLTSDEYELL
jgi:thiamine biosynthesis lipoprotein